MFYSLKKREKKREEKIKEKKKEKRRKVDCKIYFLSRE